MARFLMDYCLNNRQQGCNERVRYSRWPKLLRFISDIPAFPVGKAQERLDEICESCPNAVFMIEDKCPVCNEYSLSWGSLKKVFLRSQLGPFTAYHYVCEKCGRELYSKRVLLN